jgi:hypothetical protein
MMTVLELGWPADRDACKGMSLRRFFENKQIKEEF